MIKELYVSLIGWSWVAAIIAALYFLIKAIFYAGSWWSFFGSVFVVWLLYKVSLYYQLEKEREMRERAAKFQDFATPKVARRPNYAPLSAFPTPGSAAFVKHTNEAKRLWAEFDAEQNTRVLAQSLLPQSPLTLLTDEWADDIQPTTSDNLAPDQQEPQPVAVTAPAIDEQKSLLKRVTEEMWPLCFGVATLVSITFALNKPPTTDMEIYNTKWILLISALVGISGATFSKNRSARGYQIGGAGISAVFSVLLLHAGLTIDWWNGYSSAAHLAFTVTGIWFLLFSATLAANSESVAPFAMLWLWGFTWSIYFRIAPQEMQFDENTGGFYLFAFTFLWVLIGLSCAVVMIIERADSKGTALAAERATSVAHSKFAQPHSRNAMNAIIKPAKIAPTDSLLYLGFNEYGGRWGYKGNAHAMCIGPTRSGKSTSLVVPNLVVAKRSIIVMDTKAQLAAITARHRAKMGKVIILDPFEHLKTLDVDLAEYIVKWNPAFQPNPKSPEFASDARSLAEAIIDRSEGGNNSEFFNASMENLWTVATMWERMTKGDKASMRDIRENFADREEFLKKLKGMKESQNYAIRVAGKRAHDRFTNTNSKNDSGEDVVETIMKNTSFLDDPRMDDAMNGGVAIDFADLHKTLTTIYVILPVSKLRKQAKWLRMFVNMAINQLLDAAPKVATLPPVLFMLDEFGNLGRLPEIMNVLNVAGDLRMQLWIFLQSANQIERAYEKEYEEFFSAAGALTAFAPRGHLE
eukprot:gene17867-18096_t